MKALSSPADLELRPFYYLLALAIYSSVSLLYFCPDTLPDFWENYRGLGADPTIHMWAISWWPYAIAHHLNPLNTRAIFAPSGYNLAGAVSLPGPSIIIYPVTRALGPVVAYNVLCLACPAAAAFSAFVLCRYICHAFWPALLGGYIFGFSQYVLSELGSHLFLLFVFPVPLAVYLVLRRVDNAIGKYPFLILFVLVMAFEFLSSTELFATTTMFGAMALALSAVFFTETRSKITRTIADVGLGYALLLIILSPYLYYVVVGGLPQVLNPAEAYSNDLFAFAVPTQVLLGGDLFWPITAKFQDVWTEMAAYIGPGAWLIMILFGRRYWGSKAGKLLLLSFGLIAIASLGPKLHLLGASWIELPWVIAGRLPLVNLALPGRFGMYLFIVVSVIVAMYLGTREIPRWYRALLGICAIAFMIPNLAFIRRETTKVDTPFFLRSGEYKRYISPGDIILILPNTITSSSQALLWQAQTDFYFRSATGFYLPPEDYQRWPITASFVDGHQIPNFSEQLDAFLGAHQVKAVMLDGASPGAWPSILSKAGMSAIPTSGVYFYKVPPVVLESFRAATAHAMAVKEAAASFGALVMGASQYVDRGLPLAKLLPAEAHRLGLLSVLQDAAPPEPESSWWHNLWLGSWGGMVGVGISGNYDDLEFLIHQYGHEAVQIYFPFPQTWAKGPKSGDGQLLLLFTQQGLRRAAHKPISPALAG
jgi:hypothetical protein